MRDNMDHINSFSVLFNNIEDSKTDSTPAQKNVYATVCVRGGLIRSLYKNEDNREIEINRAAGDVFCQLVRNRAEYKEIGVQNQAIGKSAEFFGISCTKTEITEDLRKLLRVLYYNSFTQEEFEAAKQEAIERLKKDYKKPEFRSRQRGQELLEVSKGYTAEGWARNLEKIQPEDLKKYCENFVNPANTMLSITGELDDSVIKAIIEMLRSFPKGGDSLVPVGRAAVSSEENEIILQNGDDCASYYVTYFVFPDSSIYAVEKAALVMCLAQLLYGGKAEVSVDSYDSGFAVFGMPPKQIDAEKIFTETIFDKAKHIIVNRFLTMTYTNPLIFGEYAGEFYYSGIDIYELLNLINGIDAEILKKAYKDANIQIIMGCVSNNGG